MPVFTFSQLYYHQRLDTSLLQSGSIHLYLSDERLSKSLDGLKALGYQHIAFDCQRWGRKSHLHYDFKKNLSFPDYYGKNLNALDDCLNEIQFPNTQGMVLTFQNFDCFFRGREREARIVLDILDGAARLH